MRESDATVRTTIFLLLNHSIFVVSSNHVLSGTFATEANAKDFHNSDVPDRVVQLKFDRATIRIVGIMHGQQLQFEATWLVENRCNISVTMESSHWLVLRADDDDFFDHVHSRSSRIRYCEFIMTGILNFHVFHSSAFSTNSIMNLATLDRVVGRPVKIPVVGDSSMS